MGMWHSKLSPQELSYLQTVTHFTEEELRKYYKIFIKGCPSGQLNKAGFRQRFQNASPLSDPGEFSDRLFDVYDGDRNGKIDFREFICTQSIMSDDSLEKKLELAFRLYDINRDGTITQAEVLKIVRSIYKMIGSTIALQQDGDTPEKWVDKIFACMDRDKNAEITCDEFIEGSKQDPMIMQALSSRNSVGGGNSQPGSKSNRWSLFSTRRIS